MLWQRCQIHFLRNILPKAPKKNELKLYNSINILDEGFEDSFAYLENGIIHNRLKSTNYIERLNQEVRRCEKVIRIFPNEEFAIRLIGAILIDINEYWTTSSKLYIRMK